MVNITDGLDWPLKAAPQTFLYILQLFEVGQLLYRIGRLSEHCDVGLSERSTQSYGASVICADSVERRGSGFDR